MYTAYLHCTALRCTVIDLMFSIWSCAMVQWCPVQWFPVQWFPVQRCSVTWCPVQWCPEAWRPHAPFSLTDSTLDLLHSAQCTLCTEHCTRFLATASYMETCVKRKGCRSVPLQCIVRFFQSTQVLKWVGEPKYAPHCSTLLPIWIDGRAAALLFNNPFPAAHQMEPQCIANSAFFCIFKTSWTAACASI